MEQFYAISILGANARHCDTSGSFEQSRRRLNRETASSHLRHAIAWLVRGAALLGVFLLGRFALDGVLAGLLTWSAAALSVYLLWYVSKGHLVIQKDHRAKFYWLQNDAGNREFSSDDPLLATMPLQDTLPQTGPAGRAAS